MLTSQRTQSIVLLLLAAVAAATLLRITLVASLDHEVDHGALDIIPHQRELVQKINIVALSDPVDPQLVIESEKFEAHMATLRAIYLTDDSLFKRIIKSPTDVERIQEELGLLRDSWRSYRDTLDIFQILPVSEPNRSLTAEEFQEEGELLIAQLDGVSATIYDHMESELSLVRRWQALLMVVASGLAIAGILLWRGQRLEVPVSVSKAASNQVGGHAVVELVPTNGMTGVLAKQPDKALIEQEQEVLEAKATQAGIRRIRELLATYQYSQDVLQELDFSRLLRLATEKTKSMMQSDAAAICLIEPAGTTLELMSIEGETSVMLDFFEPGKQGVSLQIIATAEEAANGQACQQCVFFKSSQTGICLSAPLQVGEQSIGALCVSRQNERPFDDLEQRALELMASSVALGISNSRIAEISRHEARQAGILAERQRVAAALHDNLAQSLNYVNLKIERAQSLLDSNHGNSALEEINAISQATSAAYQQVRVALSDLQEPPVFEDNFSQELSDYVTSLQESYDLEIDMVLNESAVAKIDALTQKQALFIAREALSNVARHAQADQAWLRFGQDRGQAILVIEDNGRGFQVQDQQKRSHLGIMIMRARAERVGGELIIDSQPNQGTKVMAYFPQVHGELAATDNK